MKHNEINITYEDFPKICRICLLLFGDLKQFKDLQVYETFISISSYSSAQAEVDDILPNNICNNCIKDLENISEFLLRYKVSDNILKRIITQKTNENRVTEPFNQKQVIVESCGFNNDVQNCLRNSNIEDIHANITEVKLESSEGSSYEGSNPNDRTEYNEDVEPDGNFEQCKYDNTKKLFTCDYCGKSFERIFHLQEHINTHLGLKPFKCKICTKGFAKRQTLKTHNYIHICDKPFKCKICNKLFLGASQLNKHFITRHNKNNCNERKQKKIYSCNICRKKFKEKINYEMHSNGHNGIKRYKCESCNKSFATKCSLKHHAVTHQQNEVENVIDESFVTIKYLDNEEKKRVYSCKLCGRSYGILSKLYIHINIHKGIKPYKCNVCNKQFTHPSSLKYHVSTHVVEKPFRCNYCDWTGVNKGNLNVHLKRFHEQKDTSIVEVGENKNKTNVNIDNKNDQIFLCNICGKNFTRKSTLKTHMKIHTGEKNFECDICGFKFILKCTLNRHLAVHKNEKEFKCNICGKGLSQKAYLIKHINIFHGVDTIERPVKKDKSSIYFCSVCNKGFLFKKSLECHKKIHGESKNEESDKKDTKDFLCTQCGKQFTYKCNLDRHILITHSGEKPFECNVCGDKFTAKNSLDCHLNIHSGMKPYQCEHCHKLFRQPSSLRKHILVHTGERRFKCHICEMAFKTSTHLKTHFKRHARS